MISLPSPTLTLSTSLSLQLGRRICSAASPGDVATVEVEDEAGEAAEAATSVAVAVATVVAPVENGEETDADGEDIELLLPLLNWD